MTIYSQNYIINPSFEDTTLNAYYQNFWTGTGTFTLDSANTKSGTQSLKINSGSGGTATVWEVFPVFPNTIYRYTGWIMTQGYNDGGGKTGLEIKTGPTDMTMVQNYFSLSAAGSTTWTQFAIQFNTGASDTVVTAIMDYGLFGTGAIGDVWYDDLYFSEVTTGGSISTSQFTLSFTQYSTGKPAFALNSVLFNPVVLTVGSGSESDIINYKNVGFNVIYIPVDYNNVIGNSSLINFLIACRNQNMPVIVELGQGSLWSWLASNETCNMKLTPDYASYTSVGYQYVHYYPDIMHPSTRAFHISKFESSVGAISSYFHSPIIGFSISAYDNYHMPDGEYHPAFNTLWPHPKGEGLQTWVPYGSYAEDSYRMYLTVSSTNLSLLGFSNISEVYAPWDIDTARNLNHWRSWLQYRRWYIREYLKVSFEAIKKKTDLMVTGTFDPDFGAWERYGSPIYDYNDVMDFPIYYPWGFGSRKEGNLPALYESGIDHLWNQGKPVIAMKEFTSDISNPNYTVTEYLTEGLPYVSGYHFQQSIGSALYNEFTTLIYQINQSNTWSSRPSTAQLAVYISPNDINNLDKSVWAGFYLYQINRAYDVIYSLDSIGSYPYLFIPSGQPVFLSDSASQAKINDYIASGGEIIDNLLDILSTPNLLTNSSFESGNLSGYNQGIWAGSPIISVDNSIGYSGTRSLKVTGTGASATIWQNVSVQTNKEYVVSLWLFSPSTNRGTGTVTLEIKSNGTPYWLGPGNTYNSLGWGTGWTQVYYPINSANASSLSILALYYMYGAGTGTVWYDDLELKEIDPSLSVFDWELMY